MAEGLDASYGFPNLSLLEREPLTLEGAPYLGTLYKISLYIKAFFQDIGHNLLLLVHSLFGRKIEKIECPPELLALDSQWKQVLVEQLAILFPISEEQRTGPLDSLLGKYWGALEHKRADSKKWGAVEFSLSEKFSSEAIQALSPFFKAAQFQKIVWNTS